MTDDEFDILDELYFVTSFDELQTQTEKEPKILQIVLSQLIEKGWIKAMDEVDHELSSEEIDMDKAHTYLYLATKKGLLKHNS